MTITRIGAMIRRDIAPSDVPEQARQLEDHFDELWIVEDLPYAGGISQMAAALGATREVMVGHGIAPAPFRNPATLAMEWATLAGLYPGRISAGIGHGVQRWMHQIGADVESPLALLGESIGAVRALLAGERVSVEGRYVRLDDVALEHPPAVPPPVYAGVAGPRSLRLSGAVADGTILPEGHGPDEIAAARRLISAGRTEAGRSDHHRLTVFTAFHVGSPDDLAAPNPDISTEWSASAGTPDLVAEQLQSLIDAGADTLVLVPLANDAVQQLRLAATDVIPRLTQRRE